MLEKSKGLIVDKLRMIQLIEVDLQLLMRILVNTRNKRSIKLDPKMSKYNYSSHARYFIENTILEKRLWYDNSLLRGKKIVYNMTDLTACYDRQLAEIGFIVKESIGIKRKLI